MNRITIPGYKKEAAKTQFIDTLEDLSAYIEFNETSQLFLLSFNPSEIRPMHTHDEVRVTFIRSGKARFIMDGIEKTVVAGDIITILPMVKHSFEVIGDEHLLLAELVVVRGYTD